MTTGIKFGNIIGEYFISASLTPAAVGATTTGAQTFTLAGSGLLPGDIVMTFGPTSTINVDIVNAMVTTANQLILTFQNTTGGSVTPTAGTYNFLVFRPANGVAVTTVSD